jgi:3-oxoacyl-[acyl-carrier protein] reductase
VSALFDVAGRVIIITGGAVGIGRVYAETLAEAGAIPVLADIDAARVQEAAAALRAAGAQCVGVTVDVSDEAQTEAMAQAALDAFGQIDGLINNAALMSTLARRDWMEIPIAEWDRVMEVNLRGMFLCCRAVAPHMKRQGAGAIVNISSSRVFEGAPNRLHYTTSKMGVVGFTRALAREMGPFGVRVNCVAPGLTLSDSQAASSSPDYVAQMVQGRALPGRQSPRDVAGAVLFLLSPGSAAMTGQTLNVDGGKAMH